MAAHIEKPETIMPSSEMQSVTTAGNTCAKVNITSATIPSNTDATMASIARARRRFDVRRLVFAMHGAGAIRVPGAR